MGLSSFCCISKDSFKFVNKYKFFGNCLIEYNYKGDSSVFVKHATFGISVISFIFHCRSLNYIKSLFNLKGLGT